MGASIAVYDARVFQMGCGELSSTYQVEDRLEQHEETVSLPLWRSCVSGVITSKNWPAEEQAENSGPAHQLPICHSPERGLGVGEVELCSLTVKPDLA